MALIDKNNFKHINKNRNSVHDKTVATYTTFNIDDHKYFQIDIYGKCTRKRVNQISQSIQLDEEAALMLIDFLDSHFNFSMK